MNIYFGGFCGRVAAQNAADNNSNIVLKEMTKVRGSKKMFTKSKKADFHY